MSQSRPTPAAATASLSRERLTDEWLQARCSSSLPPTLLFAFREEKVFHLTTPPPTALLGRHAKLVLGCLPNVCVTIGSVLRPLVGA